MLNGSLILLGCLIALGASALVGIHLYVYSSLWLYSVRLRRRLAVKGRTLTLNQAKEKLARNEGILLLDAPTIGWQVLRVWWSPATDILTRPAEWKDDGSCPKEDVLNYNRFIEEESGVAKLVDGFVFKQRVRAFLEEHFGVQDAPCVLSGYVLMQQQMERELSKRTTSR